MLSQRVRGTGLKVTTHLHLLLRLGMSEVIPLLLLDYFTFSPKE
jgi:hypothetical protein